MKNLLPCLTPNKKPYPEWEQLAEIQIDNSLELGWDPKDIVIVTTFPYEYMGIKATVIGTEHALPIRPRSNNTTVIPYLIEQGIVDGLAWVHDYDAYELNKIDEEEVQEEMLDADLGLTDYGWKHRWCMGSFFVTPNSKDILEKVKDIVLTDVEDEEAMMRLTSYPNIADWCKRMDITYNFGMRHVEYNWEHCKHPIKVTHFHPYYRWYPTLDVFMYGKNPLGHPIIDERLTKLLQRHGVKCKLLSLAIGALLVLISTTD